MELYHDASSTAVLDEAEEAVAPATRRRGSEADARRVRSWSTALPRSVGESVEPVKLSSIEVLWQREPFNTVNAVTSLSLREVPVLPAAAASAADLALATLPGLASGRSGAGAAGGGGGGVSYEGTEVDDVADATASTAQTRGRAAVQRQSRSNSCIVCILLGLVDGVVAYDITQNELLNISTPDGLDAAAKKRPPVYGEGKEVLGVAAQRLERAKAEESAAVEAAAAAKSRPGAAASKVAEAAAAVAELERSLSGSADDGFSSAQEATAAAKAALLAGASPASLTVCHAAWMPTLPDTSGSSRRLLPGVNAKALEAAERMGRSRLIVQSTVRSGRSRDGVDAALVDVTATGGGYALVGACVLEAVRPFEPGSWQLQEVAGSGDWLDPTLPTAVRASGGRRRGRLSLSSRPAHPDLARAALLDTGTESKPASGSVEMDEGDLDLHPPSDDACASMGLSLRSGLPVDRVVSVPSGPGRSGVYAASSGPAKPASDGGSAAGMAALATSPLLGGRLLVSWGRHSTIAGVAQGARQGEVAWRLGADKPKSVPGLRWSQQPVAVFPSAAQPTVVSVLPDGLEVHDSVSGLLVAALPINTVVTAVRCEESTDIRRAALTPSRQALAVALQRHGRATLGPVAKRAAAALAMSGTRTEVLMEAAARWQALTHVQAQRHRDFTGDPSAAASAAAAAAGESVHGRRRSSGDSAVKTLQRALEAQACAMWAGLPSPEAVRCAAAWISQCLREPETVFVVCKRAVVAVTLQPPVVEVAGLVTASRPLFGPALRACELAVWRSKRVRAVGRQRRRHAIDQWRSASGETVAETLNSMARRRQMEAEEAARLVAPAAGARRGLAQPSSGRVQAGRPPRAAGILPAAAGHALLGSAAPSLASCMQSVVDDLLTPCEEDSSWFALGGTVPRTRVRELQTIIGYRKFDQGAFAEGLGHLLLAGERPRRVLALFPSLLPKGVALRRWLPVRVGLVIEEVMGDAIEALVRFLTVARRLLAMRRSRLHRLVPRAGGSEDSWEKDDAADFAALVHSAGAKTRVEAPVLLLQSEDDGRDDADDDDASSSDSGGNDVGSGDGAGARGRGRQLVLGGGGTERGGLLAVPGGGGSSQRQRVAVLDADAIDPADWSVGELSTIGGRAVGADGAISTAPEGGAWRSSSGDGTSGGWTSHPGIGHAEGRDGYDRLLESSASASGSARLCRVEDADEGVLVDTCLAAACIVWEAWALRASAGSGVRSGSAPTMGAADMVALMRTSSAPMDVDTLGFRLPDSGTPQPGGAEARASSSSDEEEEAAGDEGAGEGGALAVPVTDAGGGTRWVRVGVASFIGGEAAVAPGGCDLWDSDEDEAAELAAARRAADLAPAGGGPNRLAAVPSDGAGRQGAAGAARRRRRSGQGGSGSSAGALRIHGGAPTSAAAAAARERMRARRGGGGGSLPIAASAEARHPAEAASTERPAAATDRGDPAIALPPPRARRDTVHSASGASPFGKRASVDITQPPHAAAAADPAAVAASRQASVPGHVAVAGAVASGAGAASATAAFESRMPGRSGSQFSYGSLARSHEEALRQVMPRRPSRGLPAPQAATQPRSLWLLGSSRDAGFAESDRDDNDDDEGSAQQQAEGQRAAGAPDVSAEVAAARRTLRLLLISPNLCDSAETTLRLSRAGKWAEVLLLLAARSQFDEAVQMLSQSLDARVREAASLKAAFVAARNAYYHAVTPPPSKRASAGAAAAAAPARPTGAPGQLRARAAEAKSHWRAASRRARRRLRLLLAFLSCLGRPSQQLVLWTLRPLLRGALGRNGFQGALGVVCQRRPGDWLRRAAAARRRAEARTCRREELFAQGSRAPRALEAAADGGPAPGSGEGGTAGHPGVPPWVGPGQRPAWLAIEQEAAADLAETRRLPWWAGLGPDLGLGLGVPVPFPSQAGMDAATVVEWLTELDAQARVDEDGPEPEATGQPTDGGTAMRYLEFLVHDIGDPLHVHHERLARLYTAELLRLVRRRQSQRVAAAPTTAVRAADEPGRIGTLRRRLLRLLGASPAVPAAELLGALPPHELLEERVLLLRRLGLHRRALEICVGDLRDAELAVKYCDAVAVADLMRLEGAPAALWTAGRQELARAAAAAATRLGVFQRPSSSGLLVQDGEDEADDDSEALGRAEVEALAGLVAAEDSPKLSSTGARQLAGLPKPIAAAWWRESGSAAVRSALCAASQLADCLRQGNDASAGALAVTSVGVAELASDTVPVVSQGPVMSSASRRHPVYGMLMQIVSEAATPLQDGGGPSQADAATTAARSPSGGSPSRSTLAATAVSSPAAAVGAHGRLLSPSPLAKLPSPANAEIAPAALPTASQRPAINNRMWVSVVNALQMRAQVLPTASVLDALPGTVSVSSVSGLLAAMASSLTRDARSSAVEVAMTRSRAAETSTVLQQRREELTAAAARRNAQAEQRAAERRAEAHEAARQLEMARLRAVEEQAQHAAVSGGRDTRNRARRTVAGHAKPAGGADKTEDDTSARLRRRHGRPESMRMLVAQAPV